MSRFKGSFIFAVAVTFLLTGAEAQTEEQRAAQMQQTIDQYKGKLAECKDDSCALIMYQLGSVYYSQQASLGTKADYSMAKQTLEQLLKEYPMTTLWSAAKQMLMTIEIASMPPELQIAARPEAQAKLWQETIEHYNKLLPACKNDNCANIIYTLGATYYSQQTSLGAKADYSTAKQMFERLLNEYPNYSLAQMAKAMLTNIENIVKNQAAQKTAQEAAQQRMQSQIDQQKKQLADCEVKKSDNCAAIMYQLGTTYYSQQASLGVKADYSMAKQMFQRLLKEYPNSPYASTAKSTLTQIEIQSLPPEQQQAAQQRAAQQAILQSQIDGYDKLLKKCETQKSDGCAATMFKLGEAYYKQADINITGVTKSDYSMAIQMLQRLLKEYPSSKNSENAIGILMEIETKQKSKR